MDLLGDNRIIEVTITELKVALPPFVNEEASLEEQVRSVLQLLMPYASDGSAPAEHGDPNQCPNCDAPAESLSSPYCSETCRNQAAFIRQFRSALASGVILNPEKQVAFGERLWWLLGGGLPMRESRIPESAKRQVIKRCSGLCEFCAAPMAAIENFGSGCNRPLHLRAVCGDCSKTKQYGDLEFAQSPTVVQLLHDLSVRINAAMPSKPCDDPDNWDWRDYVAQRRNSMKI
ncbi:MAG: hypothetical protein KF824_12590 [Fimbriimonadaceae bacterium]|nr:MAG: hypothetical protein KF824_12590 [Fimbriimonadaceae bacterium]